MRKLTTLLVMALMAVTAMAIPAHRGMSTITQPDGTKLTINLIGDEFYHFNTTTDGYTIVKNDAGIYVYAQRSGESLAASQVKAHNVGERNAAEEAYLASTQKFITDREARNEGEARRVKRDAPSTEALDYTKFRGLIILINFTDVQFTMSNPKAFYEDMVNTIGFTGYVDDNGKNVSCTGSMRDYYSENTNGIFNPYFDIVGPVSVNYASTDCRGTSNAQTIFRAALAAAEQAGCDFSKYDADNNGTVDMVFFQVAGMSSSFSGNESNLLWPHKSSMWNSPTYDGKRFGTYACSNELYGFTSVPSTITVEGIGTMCHEFTHVMGFPDLYDTNYETSGQSHDPGDWDVMAGGGSNNYGRTPVGYTIFERYAMGFAKPQVITGEGTYTLEAVNKSNTGYIFRSPVSKEYFIIDNRQKTRWDYYLPGHGMVVCRVDSTSTTPWSNNRINADPSHNYYEMLRAGNTTSDALASDPFPGTKGVVQLCSYSTPALKTWNGTTSELGFFNITENAGVITFEVKKETSIQKDIEDFETMPVTTSKTATGVQGRFTTWDFNQCFVTAPGEGECSGANAVSMVLPSAFTMAAPVYYDSYQVSFDVNNPSTTVAKYALTYSTDGGTTWVKPKSSAGSTPVSVAAGTKQTITWPIELAKSKGVIYRVAMSAGSKTVASYIDNFTIFYNGTPGGGAIKGDVNGDGFVDITDVNVILNIILGNDEASKYDGRADVNGDGNVDITDVNAIINIILNS